MQTKFPRSRIFPQSGMHQKEVKREIYGVDRYLRLKLCNLIHVI